MKNKTKQNKTKQNKTKQNKTKQIGGVPEKGANIPEDANIPVAEGANIAVAEGAKIAVQEGDNIQLPENITKFLNSNINAEMFAINDMKGYIQKNINQKDIHIRYDVYYTLIKRILEYVENESNYDNDDENKIQNIRNNFLTCLENIGIDRQIQIIIRMLKENYSIMTKFLYDDPNYNKNKLLPKLLPEIIEILKSEIKDDYSIITQFLYDDPNYKKKLLPKIIPKIIEILKTDIDIIGSILHKKNIIHQKRF